MDDIAWLHSKLDLLLVGEELNFDKVRALAKQHPGFRGYAVEPTHLNALPASWHKIALVGYPTGRHHDLVLAAEARLAVAEGADEIWLSVDTQTETLGTIAAVEQAISPVGLFVTTDLAIAENIEAALDYLEQGHSRIAVSLPI